MTPVLRWALRQIWPFGLTWALLWVGAAVAVGWTGVHFMAMALRGITGFNDSWQVLVGLALIGLFVWALLTYRDPSPWRAVAIAAFAATAAAFASGAWLGDTTGPVVSIVVVAAMVGGIGATVATYGRDAGHL